MHRVPMKRNPYYPHKVGQFSLAAGAEAANVRRVTVQAQDPDFKDLARVVRVRVWLSDVATGVGVAAAAPSGGVAVGTKGAVLAAVVAGKVLDCVTDATGALELDVTEVAAKTFHVLAENPDGTLAHLALVFA